MVAGLCSAAMPPPKPPRLVPVPVLFSVIVLSVAVRSPYLTSMPPPYPPYVPPLPVRLFWTTHWSSVSEAL